MEKERVGKIIHEHRAFMVGVVLGSTGNVEDAEDVAQEASIRMLSQRKGPPDDRAFAYTIVRRESCISFERAHAAKRDAGRTEFMDSSNPLHQRATSSAEETVLARETIREADPYARALGEGYTAREIAQVTGQRENIVYDRAEDWRKRQREGARTTKKPRREVLQAVWNFEMFWTGTPLNDFRRAEGLPEITQEELNQKKRELNSSASASGGSGGIGAPRQRDQGK